MFSRISCWYLRKILARVPIDALRQVLNALPAAATAAFSSSAVASGTRARTSCVAGLRTSRHWVVRDSTSLPSISNGTVGIFWAGMSVSCGSRDSGRPAGPEQRQQGGRLKRRLACCKRSLAPTTL